MATPAEETEALVRTLKADVAERMQAGDRSPEVLSMLERIEKLEVKLANRLALERMNALAREHYGVDGDAAGP